MNGIKIHKKALERYVNQGASSLVQLILGLIVLSLYNIHIFGVWAIFQIIIGLIGGVFSNTIIYRYSLNNFKLCYNDKFAFFAFALALIFISMLFSNKISPILLVLAVLRNFEYVFSELVIRRSYESKSSVQWIGILRMLVAFLLALYFLKLRVNLILYLCVFIYSINFIFQLYKLIYWNVFQSSLSNQKTKVVYSLKAYILYYLRGQVPVLMLSFFSLSALGGLSVARYFATPVVQLAPVISSLVMSSSQLKISVKNQKKILFIGLVFLLISLAMSRYILDLFSIEEIPFIELLIAMLIILAFISNYRTYLESVVLRHKNPQTLYRIGYKTLVFTFLVSLIFINYFGSLGSILALLLMEGFVIYSIKVVYGNTLQ